MVIEYLLIFGLGFFAAMLLVLLALPTVHRRVVILTERRIRATVPLSTSELRAEKDAARALHAMENHRLAVETRKHRETAAQARIRHDKLVLDLEQLTTVRANLEDRIAAMDADTADLRSRLDREEDEVRDLKATLAAAEESGMEKDSRISDLSGGLDHLTGEFESLKVELVTRETEVETHKARISTLEDDRRKLREEVKRSSDETSDLRLRLDREEGRTLSLDAKLSSSVARLTDREGTIERRSAEIDRLKKKLETATGELSGVRASLKKSETRRKMLETKLERLTKTATAGESGNAENDETGTAEGQADVPDDRVDLPAISERVARLRTRHSSLIDHLNQPDRPDQDNSLRSEISEIAAMMVDLTAAKEGPTSPIHGLLTVDPQDESSSNGRTLADRSRALIRQGMAPKDTYDA